MVKPNPRTAVSLVFALSGFIVAAWVARIPAVTTKLNLDTAQLGLILLFVAVGSLSAFQVIGRLIDRYGSARTTFWFGIGISLCPLILAIAPVAWVLAVGLFVYGFMLGAVDVAMNAQGVTVEHYLRKKIMGSLHGYFSMGALVGAAASAALAGLGMGLESNLLVIATVSLVLALWCGTGYIADATSSADTESPPSKRSWLPPQVLWPLGFIAFCAAVGEGAMADWGALYLHDQLGTGEGMAAVGFVAFSTTMLFGRFACDYLVMRFGARRVVDVGAIVAVIGLAIGLLVATSISAIAGFAILGFGLAPGFPVVYSAAGSIPGIGSGRGVAAVATIGYSGFLVGPPILGILARFTSIGTVFVIVGLLALSIPFFTRSLKRPASGIVTTDPAVAVNGIHD